MQIIEMVAVLLSICVVIAIVIGINGKGHLIHKAIYPYPISSEKGSSFLPPKSDKIGWASLLVTATAMGLFLIMIGLMIIDWDFFPPPWMLIALSILLPIGYGLAQFRNFSHKNSENET